MAGKAKRQVLICGVQYDKQLKSGTMEVQELPAIAARLGAQGVEFREVYWKDRGRQIPLVREALAATGMIPTYATFTTLFNRDPEARQRLLADLDDARAIGAGMMRVFRGEWPSGPEEADMWDGAWAAIEKAGAYGMHLALENFSGSVGNKYRQIYEAIQAINSPVMVVNIDTSNYVRNGEDLMMAIKRLGPWIGYSHLKDVKRTNGTVDVTYLGNGDLNFREIIAAYDATGRQFPLCMEFGGGDDPEAAIANSLAHLAAL
ncbi:MAG: sugar phosphate isomerase/epimerase [Chloroflexi bacterium]|nr:sugar phosphate isomerase/epimerase [Chloroflexota bacterium]